MQDLTGTSIESYNLEELLYEEGSVQVYLGTHRGLKKTQTIYVIHSGSAGAPSIFVDGLIGKAQAAAQLDSQLGLIKVQDVDRVNGRYYATDFVQGPALSDLFEVLSRLQRQIAVVDVVRMIGRIVRALEHAYIKSQLHVSLLPHTIKFRPDPQTPAEQKYLPVLTDMGITMFDGEMATDSAENAQKLLRSVGFLLYSLLTNITVDPRLDDPDMSVAARLLSTWPLAQADEMLRLLERLILAPPQNLTQGVALVLKEIEQFHSLQIPGQVTLGEVYQHVLQQHSSDKAPPLWSSGPDGVGDEADSISSGSPVMEDAPPVPEGKGQGDAEIHYAACLIQVTGLDAEIEYRLENRTIVVGRSPQSDIVVPDPRASRNHLKIEHKNGQVTVTDLGSLNGTKIDGKVIARNVPHVYRPDQVMQIGPARMRISSTKSSGTPFLADDISELKQGNVSLPPRPAPSPESLVIPSFIHVNALRQDIPKERFAFLPNNRMLAVFVPLDVQTKVEPGQALTVSAYVMNFSRGELYQVSLAASGVPVNWLEWPAAQESSDGQALVSAFTIKGGEQRQVDIAIAPKREPGSRMGKYRLIVSLSQDKDGESAEQKIPLKVEGFSSVRWSVEPEYDGADLVARIAIVNLGNRPNEAMTLTCWEGADSGTLNIEPAMENFTLSPGQQIQKEIRISSKKRSLIGRNKTHQLLVQLSTQGPAQSRPVTYVEKGRISLG